MNNKLIVEPSPHIRNKNTTDKIMVRVIIALMPALFMAVYIFGVRALTLSLVCVVSCMVFEIAFRRLVRKDKGIDPSPAVTGLLLAYCLPVTLPYHMAVIGCFIAIVVVKQVFGGLGQNFANPAAVARIVLTLSFTRHMTTWVVPFHYREGVDAITEATSAATPIADSLAGKTGATPLALEAGEQAPELIELFLGFHGGSLGETSSFALIIGLLYMVLMRVVRPVTPLAFIGTVAFGSLIAGEDVLLSVLSGGLILGAAFMATDYATTPVSLTGKFVFGVGCGLLTLVMRFFSDMPEGVIFSILIMNILTYYIDKFTFPKAFGTKKPLLELFRRREKGGKNEN